MSKRRKVTVNFTPNENYVVSDVVSRVIDGMQWDDSLKSYADEGNIILFLSKYQSHEE